MTAALRAHGLPAGWPDVADGLPIRSNAVERLPDGATLLLGLGGPVTDPVRRTTELRTVIKHLVRPTGRARLRS